MNETAVSPPAQAPPSTEPFAAHDGVRPRAATREPRITGRSVFLGLLLTVGHTSWLIYEELALQHVGTPTYFVLVQTVVGMLFVLLAANSLLARVRPAWVFSSAELMVIFVMTTLGAITTARNLLHYLFPMVLWPRYMPAASGGAGTAAGLSPYFSPADPAAVKRFFVGTRDFWAFFHPENLRPWLVPLGYWGLFLLGLLLTMVCLASIVRRPWLDQERLPFPILDLPVLMASEGAVGPLFSRRLLLLGFVVTCALLSLNYVASIVPSVPGLKLSEQDVGSQYIASPPWTTVSPLLTVWWPYAIGLCYLIPLDVSFSCWFLFILIRLLVVAATALGWRDQGSAHDLNQFPYFGNATEGAWIGMFAVVLWNARGFIRQVARACASRTPIPGDEHEAIPYRVALVGTLAGGVLLVGLAVAAGMRPVVGGLAFGLFFLAIVVMTRMYAQVSLPLFCMAFYSFTSWTTSFTGTLSLTRAEASSLTTFYWFDRTYEQLPMAHHLEAFVFADRLRQSKRTMLYVILLSTAVAIVVGMLTLLQVFYDRGAASARVSQDSTWLAGVAWARYVEWTGSPRPVQAAVLARTASSAAVVVLLSAARSQWVGFPLHPIGYLFAVSFALEWGMWNIILLTWLVKALVVRYGGLRLYRALVPFFLGMALGDAVTHFVWGVGLSLVGARGASPYL